MVGYVPGGMAWHSMMLGQGQEKSYIWTREAMVVALGIRRRGNGIQLAWGEVERRDRMAEESISAKELVPIVIACAVGGGRWVGRAVPVSCDNTGAMAAVNSGYSRSPQLNAPAKILVFFFIRAHFQLEVRACHVPGTQNIVADAISRNNLSIFVHRHHRPGAARQPSPRTEGITPGTAARLDIHRLDDLVQQLSSAGLAPASNYKSGTNRQD